MNTNAIYIIHEDEREFYFLSKYAGGFSYPFEVAGYLNSLKYTLKKTRIREQNIYVAPLLAQMRGTCCFPASLKDTLLFQEITKETAMAERTLKDIPFMITLDINRYTVAFHFNNQVEALADLPDITFPCFDPKSKYSGGHFLEESLTRQEASGHVSFEETNEATFRELIRQAATEQRLSSDQPACIPARHANESQSPRQPARRYQSCNAVNRGIFDPGAPSGCMVCTSTGQNFDNSTVALPAEIK